MSDDQNNKICSKGDVPFSWEHKPGVSKVTPQQQLFDKQHYYPDKLPPPPCEAAPGGCRRRFVLPYHQDLQIPPPPCTFQQAAAMRSSSQKGLRKMEDDPFLIAFQECTKTGSKDTCQSGQIYSNNANNKFIWFSKDDGEGFRVKNKKKNKKKKNSNLLFSCKNSCGVVEDKVIKVSQIPVSKSQREEGVCKK